MSKKNADNLVWIDLEMTGLDPDKERIIEIATIVTDPHLNVLAEGPVLAIHQSDELLGQMDEWNTSHHGNSGLVERVKASPHSAADAERLTIEFLSEYVGAGESPICGNSIGQDRRFLRRYMPALDDFFHYRSLDVSTVKELVRRWRPEVAAGLVKKGSHLALDDVRESIAELAYYREHFLKVDDAPQ